MWVNPFPFGVAVGVISTIVVEVVALIVLAMVRSSKK